MFLRIAVLFLLLVSTACSAEGRQNVLFIIVDDLRPELPVYGQEHIEAPNISSLAAGGVVFANAYSNVPVCGASRASFMTGVRPTKTRFTDFDSRADVDAPDAVPLHAFLASNGYHTESIGKVMHNWRDWKDAWSVPPWKPGNFVPEEINTGFRNYQDPANIALFRSGEQGPSTEALDVPDDAYFDGQVASKAIESLEKLSKSEEPFLLAVGFVKPHLPFTAPKKYWDLYDRERIHPARNNVMPEGMPSQAQHSWGELRNYRDVPDAHDEPVDDELARKLRHGYYASVSYADAQVGRVLDSLRTLGLESSTIVVLIGDHGFALGEHGNWVKHSPFDVATRTVAIVRAPGMAASATADGLVEFIDIYPTLADLLGLEPPAHLDGQSFVPLLQEPDAPGKPAVFPRWKNADVIKTERYALTTWAGKDDRIIAEMMFDHETDRDENVNIVDDPDYRFSYQELRRVLAEETRRAR